VLEYNLENTIIAMLYFLGGFLCFVYIWESKKKETRKNCKLVLALVWPIIVVLLFFYFIHLINKGERGG